MISNNKSGFYIGVTCPGCGGDLELESDFFVLTCHSCGSAIRIKMPDIPPAYLIQSTKSRREARSFADHYLKKLEMPLTESGVEIRKIFQPYWKVDAVMLKVRNRIEERHIYVSESGGEQDIVCERKKTDINLASYSMTHSAGAEDEEIPHSIGLRASYMRMETYSQDSVPDDCECLPVVRPWKEVIDNIEQGTARLNEINPAAFGKNKSKLFRPVASIVYFPYYIIESHLGDDLRRLIVDGVSGSVVEFSNKCRPLNLSGDTGVQMEFGQLEIELHRCPNCGFDLPGKQSYIYICDNCSELILLESHPLMDRVIYKSIDVGGPADRLFPFWSMKLPGADHSLIKSMFGGIFESDRLMMPAFRSTNYEAMFKLSQRMSSAAPKMDCVPVENFDNKFESVTLGLNEALVMAEITIYRAKTGKMGGETSDNDKFQPSDISLIYFPFHPESYFYVDSTLNAVTFEKNMVK